MCIQSYRRHREFQFQPTRTGLLLRHKPDGSFSNATACGNETASERPMFRKFMLESVLYWVREYHIDGFPFRPDGCA